MFYKLLCNFCIKLDLLLKRFTTMLSSADSAYIVGMGNKGNVGMDYHFTRLYGNGCLVYTYNTTK